MTEQSESNETQVSQPENSRGQIGGNHYERMAIDPLEFCHANHFEAAEGAIIKYVCRHRFKGGAEDLLKAIHILERLLELEYGTSQIRQEKSVSSQPSSPNAGGDGARDFVQQPERSGNQRRSEDRGGAEGKRHQRRELDDEQQTSPETVRGN